jgi:hypothetical protein
MADEEPEQPLVGVEAVDHVLEVCGFLTPANRASVRSEGFADISDFGMMKVTNFASMATRISRMRPAAGGFRFGEVHVRNLEALAYWVRDKQRRNELLVAREFTQAVRDQCRRDVDTEYIEITQAEASKTTAPAKFVATDWVSWEIVFANYLAGLYGVSGVPLSYVIRKNVPGGHAIITESERLVSAAPLTGRVFQSDTQKVYRILKSVTVGTDAWEWIKVYDSNQDGRLAFKALREHYDGPGEIDKRISLARTQIKELFYKNEQTFSFEKFVTKLNGAFQMLAECHEDLTEKNKVDHMITAMSQCTNSAIIAATTTILMNPEMRNNFLAAANKMTEVIANIFPAVQLHRRGRNVAFVQTGRGRGRGRGGGRGGRSPGGQGRGGGRGRGGGPGTNTGSRMCNGVDISDLTRWFPPAQWFKLSAEVQAEAKAAKAAKKRKVAAITAGNPTPQDVPLDNNAGNAFGGASYTEGGSKRPKSRE